MFDLFELHRLQELLVRLEVALGIDVVLRVETALHGFFARVVFHDFDVFQAIIGHGQLRLQGRSQVDDTFVYLALGRLHLFCGGLHGWMILP